MATIVEVAGLDFEYPGIRALDEVSFELAAGTITALVGPNGAGKTTLMRCLCGLLRPFAGRISIAGIDVIEAPRRSHTQVGFLPDFSGGYTALTVGQCLRYAAAANGVGASLQSRVEATARDLGLDTRLGQKVGELSRGLRQRVAIGQAVIHEPPLLVLDEPASGLDPEARHALAILFRTLQTRGMTLLVSSHILAELADYATHLLVMREGRMVEHRALVETSARAHLRLAVLGPREPLVAWLRAYPGIGAVEDTGSDIRLEFDGAHEAQARLLAAMIAQGHAVIRFGSAEPDLQQAYLASMRAPAHASR
jgi:ABC-2 type transport system ATP-binding protein